MREIVLKALEGKRDSNRVYISAGVLKTLGCDPQVLDGVPDDRPVPLLVCDVKRLLVENGDEGSGEESV